MTLLSAFRQNIHKHHLFSSADQLIIAVSGGVDSIVLVELCKQAGFVFSIAHCNFQLRGEESERDEQFVRQLAIKYGVGLQIKKFDTITYADSAGLSIQEAARDLRYGWFKELVKTTPQSPGQHRIYILTAHHADDNAETAAMNFFRGTGLRGLTGIPASNDVVKRPLLPFTKEELRQFAAEQGLSWVEDSSNQLSKYTRNLFRNEILPSISKVYPNVHENLRRSTRRFEQIESLYELGLDMIRKRLLHRKGEEVHISIQQLLSFNNTALIYEIIAPYGFTERQVDEVLKLAESESGKYIEAPDHSHRIIRHRRWFIIGPVASASVEHFSVDEATGKISFAAGTLYLEKKANADVSNSSMVACLDAALIQFPLLVRKWKAGDYFYPLGMKKKKKLARFFIDQKLSKTEKEKTWVIEMNKKIIWVVGHRIDDRVKITDATQNVLRLTWDPS